MKVIRYRQIQDSLKKDIQQGKYKTGDFLPSENELCSSYNITRTTARKALEELQKDGFIIRLRGKGSKVRKRREALGLLTVKGFSEAVNHPVKNVFLQHPVHDNTKNGMNSIAFKSSISPKSFPYAFFSRLRYVEKTPTMVENSWLSLAKVPGFTEKEFIDDSFFKTLSQRYQIEIIGSEQELRSLPAPEHIAQLLQIKKDAPILKITVKYHTSIPDYYIFSILYCNTNKYPIGNSYFVR